MHESFFQRFMCLWCCSPCFLSLCDCIFPCVTLHSVFSSYLEHSVWWLEFICLCSIHRFRYYMIFSTKVDMEFVLDALYWWAVPSSFLFHLDKWNDCNYVIILPLISLVYTSLWSFICIWLHAQWICDCFNRTNKSLNIVYHLVLQDLYWEIPPWKKIPISS